MTSGRQLYRALAINRVLIRHGLDEFLAPTPLFRYRWLLKLVSGGVSQRDKELSRGQRLREALIELGPIFIKFGQMLSTRRDLVPEDIADELALLQDQVAPFSPEQARRIIEQELGLPVEQLFAAFSAEPLASASVAQVHAATLRSGEEVVVKVIRPGIRRKIEQDLSLLKRLAGWLEKYSAEGRRLRAKKVVDDYERTIYDELDLRIEAANTSQLRRNFSGSDRLYVPLVYFDYTRPRVMVMERISGIQIADIPALQDAGVNMKVLADRGVEIFFTQVFRDSFFHADMHPGNIFVDASDPQQPRYIAIDCGIMGALSREDKRYLAENFLAFFNRDYRQIARLHVRSGWVPAGTSIEEFEAAVRAACEPIFGKALAEISFGHFLVQLFQTARRFNMEVQPQLVLLQKTLLYIEGLGRQLYPELDLWETAKPYLEKWMREQIGPKALLQQLKTELPYWADTLPQLPGLVHQAVDNLSGLNVKIDQLVVAQTAVNMAQYRQRQQLLFAVSGATLALSGTLLWSLDKGPWWLAALLAGVGGLLLIKSLWQKKPAP